MIKFMILFRQPLMLETFEARYNTFLALVEQMPHIQRRQVASITGSPAGSSPYYRVLEIYFANKESMEASLQSTHGQAAGVHLNSFQQGSFEMLFAEVYEEVGGQTPTTGVQQHESAG